MWRWKKDDGRGESDLMQAWKALNIDDIITQSLPVDWHWRERGGEEEGRVCLLSCLDWRVQILKIFALILADSVVSKFVTKTTMMTHCVVMVMMHSFGTKAGCDDHNHPLATTNSSFASICHHHRHRRRRRRHRPSHSLRWKNILENCQSVTRFDCWLVGWLIERAPTTALTVTKTQGVHAHLQIRWIWCVCVCSFQ